MDGNRGWFPLRSADISVVRPEKAVLAGILDVYRPCECPPPFAERRSLCLRSGGYFQPLRTCPGKGKLRKRKFLVKAKKALTFPRTFAIITSVG